MFRTIEFSYKILRRGVDYGYIYPAAGASPTLRMQDSSEIKTSFSGSFAPSGLDAAGAPIELDLFSDEIQPNLIIDSVPFPLGIFLPASVTPRESNGVESLQIEAYDRNWRIRDTYTDTILHFPAGASYLATIKALLASCGIRRISQTYTSAAFPEAREDWDIGTSYLTIINTLLAEISYNPIWFDAQGAAVLEPASVPTADNIEHTLNDSNVESLLLPQISRETDIYQAPNVFIAICSNADKRGPLVAVSENANPQSPLSTVRRGRRIVRVVRVNNTENQQSLQAYADKLKNDSLLSGETIRVSTGLLPGFGVADVTALHYGDLSAVCIEREWTMQLQVGGRMDHVLERVIPNFG